MSSLPYREPLARPVLGAASALALALAGSAAAGPQGSQLAGGPPAATNLATNLAIDAESFVASGEHAVLRAREFVQGADLTGDGDAFDWPAFHYDFRRQRLALIHPNVTQRAAEMPLVIEGDVAALQAFEAGVDLNGDGDGIDRVAHLYRFSTGERTNLGLALEGFNHQHFVLREGVLAMLVSEYASTTLSGQGADLDGDGDRFDEVLFLHDVAAGTTVNTRLSGDHLWVEGGRLATSVLESQHNADLNGDGDKLDPVVHLFDLHTGAATNLRVAGRPLALHAGRVLVSVDESQQKNKDLNSDRDTDDWVLHTYDVASGALVNHGLWGDLSRGQSYDGYNAPDRDGRFVALYVAEAGQRADLNADGDRQDFVLHVYDFRDASLTNTRFAVVQGGAVDTFPELCGGQLRFWVDEEAQRVDLNGDGDAWDTVMHVRDVEAGRTRNLALAGGSGGSTGFRSSQRWLAFTVDEQGQAQTDLNGDGDLWDRMLTVYDTKLGELRTLGPSAGLFELDERALVYLVDEADSGADLNGDGDLADDVAHLYRLDTGETRSLGLAVLRPGVAMTRHFLLAGVYEMDQGAVDLDGNGVPFNDVAHVVPLFERALR